MPIAKYERDKWADADFYEEYRTDINYCLRGSTPSESMSV